MSTQSFDWTTVDWHNADADDPRRFAKGFRRWTFYAQPLYVRDNGTRHQPREFRAGSERAARNIIAASPSGRGHIVRWNERTNQRDLIATVTN